MPDIKDSPITITAAPCVSVIIPAFNCGSLIVYSLESLINQDYQNWECIVVDDGSSDNTMEIVQSYVKRDKRIVYVYQKNGGPSKARNTGLSRAGGKYIQFLDADDLIESRKLQCHARYLENNPEVDIVYGEARYFRTEYPEERRSSMSDIDLPWTPKVSGSGKEIQKALLRMNIMVVSAPLLRRRIIDQVGLFDEELPLLEDWDYWIRCAVRGGRFQYLDEDGALSLIRWRPNSLSQDRFRMRKQGLHLRHKLSKVLQDKSLIEYNEMILAGYCGLFGAELIESGCLFDGMWRLLNASYRSSQWNESLKWIYSALVAPFAPRNNFQKIVSLPIRESLNLLLRGCEINKSDLKKPDGLTR